MNCLSALWNEANGSAGIWGEGEIRRGFDFSIWQYVLFLF